MSSENGDSGMKWTQLSSRTPKSPPGKWPSFSGALGILQAAQRGCSVR